MRSRTTDSTETATDYRGAMDMFKWALVLIAVSFAMRAVAFVLRRRGL